MPEPQALSYRNPKEDPAPPTAGNVLGGTIMSLLACVSGLVTALATFATVGIALDLVTRPAGRYPYDNHDDARNNLLVFSFAIVFMVVGAIATISFANGAKAMFARRVLPAERSES